MVEFIEIRCNCGKKLRVPKSRAGQAGKCVRCGEPVAIPEEPALEEESEWNNFLSGLETEVSSEAITQETPISTPTSPRPSARGLDRGLDIIKKEGHKNYFVKKNRYKSCQVITSGSKEYVGDKLKGTNHSPFAYFLIRMLKLKRNQYFSTTYLYAQMAKSVANATNQTPRYGVLKKSLDEGGEFFFVRSK